MTIAERILKIRKDNHLTRAEFGKKLGISQDAVANIEYNRNKKGVPDNIIKLIAVTFNINEEWLLTGKGEMLKKDNLFSLDEFLKKRNATSLEIEFMKIYFTLEENVRKKIISDFKKAILKEEIVSQSSENKNNELSATNENSETDEEPKETFTEYSTDMTIEEITKQIGELGNLLEKKQKEELSASQKDELA